ncbi:uncharacterized protein K444DRAFT_638706 [Hyaloscypha bicolor E]|uniref:Uncharacterized protein n=1 Tax=Hyaloscypha bicolor E TaxID=1095630 RepID=A0A2J6SEK4_9HELO|nr:uncharacterized protein K444DRAFT_638706 [Hyaloscypha bicolor E]PMD49192.1 hypothetical protein K444DRAFT_638706 [Hyaloscypha bicolor E]
MYLVDSGIDLSSPVNVHGEEPKWLYPGENVDDEGYPFQLRVGQKDDKEKKIQHRAVASLPFGFPPIGSFSASSGRIPKLGDPLFPMYEATQALIDTGIVMTTASGNWGQESVWGPLLPPLV